MNNSGDTDHIQYPISFTELSKPFAIAVTDRPIAISITYVAKSYFTTVRGAAVGCIYIAIGY